MRYFNIVLSTTLLCGCATTGGSDHKHSTMTYETGMDLNERVRHRTELLYQSCEGMMAIPESMPIVKPYYERMIEISHEYHKFKDYLDFSLKQVLEDNHVEFTEDIKRRGQWRETTISIEGIADRALKYHPFAYEDSPLFKDKLAEHLAALLNKTGHVINSDTNKVELPYYFEPGELLIMNISIEKGVEKFMSRNEIKGWKNEEAFRRLIASGSLSEFELSVNRTKEICLYTLFEQYNYLHQIALEIEYTLIEFIEQYYVQLPPYAINKIELYPIEIIEENKRTLWIVPIGYDSTMRAPLKYTVNGKFYESRENFITIPAQANKVEGTMLVRYREGYRYLPWAYEQGKNPVLRR